MESQTSPKIFHQIALIMAEIGAIGKNRKNIQQNYNFRGIEDVYNTTSPILAKHQVFCVPRVMDLKREDRQTAKGGFLMYTILTIRYTFYAMDGSSIEVVTVGEAMDSGDKSCNKAMSTAQKYAFSQVFAIPHPGTEGVRFEQMDTGDWLIIIYMGQPSKEERKIIRKANVVTRYLIDESKTMVMALIRFESTGIIYELVFDPTRYKKPREVNVGNAY